jgi:hypothetical protein
MKKPIDTILSVVLFVSAFALVFCMALIKIGDYDVWYHLRAGKFILETGAIRHLEPFAYTAPNAVWSMQSWLAGVIFYVVYSIGSINGLIVFNALVVTLIFFFVYLTMRLHAPDKKGAWLMMAVLVVAVFATRFRIPIRPHVLEFLLLAVSLYALSLYRAKGRNFLYALPVIQILWVNVHGSHVLGLLLPLIFLMGTAIDAFLLKRDDMPTGAVKTLAVVFAANVVATLVNPTAHEALLFPFMLTSQATYMQNINEWQPLGLEHVWGYGLRYTWGYVALVALMIAGFPTRGKKASAIDFMLFIAFFAMTLKGVRLIAEFAIAVSPMVVRSFAPLATRLGDGASRAASVAVAAIILVVALPSAILGKTYSFGLGVKDVFPERGVKFIEDNNIGGEMFNSFAFGDYLAWRAYPERKVFIHGRNDVIPQTLYTKYLDAHSNPDVWRELADEYDVNYTILEYYQTDYGGEEAIMHLSHNSPWVPVYWDRLAIVYVKDDPRNQDVINRWGYRYIRPNYLDFSYLAKYDRETILGPVMEELGRLIESSPTNEEAYLARAYIYFRLGSATYDLSARDLKSALEINPRQAATHSALGMIYERKGDAKGAKEAYEKALDIDPADEGALAGQRRLTTGR